MRRLRDWIFTVPFLVAFGVVFVLFDIIGRVALLFGLRPFERVMSTLQRVLVALLRISGTRISVERSPHIDPERGYVLVSNHQSLFDIPLVGAQFTRTHPKYVAKKSLGKWLPSISLNLRRGGSALIDRGEGIGAVRSIVQMARTAQERNVSVVIFPEGTRSRDGQPGRFHRSGTQALLRAADEMPVIPVAIDGSWRLLLHNLLPVPFGTRIKVALGDPIERTPKDGDALAEATEQWILQRLEVWRA